MRAVELFAGAGGMALGVAQAGFQHALMVEFNPEACATLRANRGRGTLQCSPTAIREMDSRQVDYSAFAPADLVVGGPPCQPFSLGGKHGGRLDDRDMFPEAVRAVRELRPRIFVFENVKGFVRASFSAYLEYVTLQLRKPTEVRLAGEEWTGHSHRLQALAGQTGDSSKEYHVAVGLLNAADYGVPQKRERVFLVGIRKDLGLSWSFPPKTHSEASLVYDQWQTGEYWRRHQLPIPDHGGFVRTKTVRQCAFKPLEKPWRTVRDAIGHLPPPEPQGSMGDHALVEGARSYRGHTGSRLDEPAKTLKAGDHGVPGGENTLALEDGTVRYFTVTESARIQTFPDQYRLQGSWTEKMRQIGNAVPPLLARVVVERARDILRGTAAANQSDE